MKIHNRKSMKEIRRHLRHSLTPAEAALWKGLKGSKLEGKKFRRQHSIGNYVVDFYCPECKLAIELDGQKLRSMDAFASRTKAANASASKSGGKSR